MTTVNTNNVPTKTTAIRSDKLLATNAATSATCNILLSEVRQYFYPEDFGAVGDGITDDTAALIACAAAAAYQVMALRPGVGRTYIYSGSITLSEYTTLLGNGATLKRRSGTSLVSTTLTEIAASAPAGTIVQVADPTKFIVGMNVSIDDGNPNTDGDGNASTFTNQTHKITAINGDLLTLATAFAAGITFPIGSYIRMSTPCLIINGVGCKVSNVIFDGNRANNKIGADMWGYWVHHQEIYTYVGAIIENCEIKNAQAEGIAGGYDRCIIQNNYIHDCAGNGVHLSGSYGTRIKGNTFKDNNLLMGPGTHLTETTRHNEGHITFSDSIYRTVISDNNFEDTNNYGIGSFNTNSEELTVANNTFVNCVNGPMQILAGGKKVIFANNQIKDCGLFDIDDTSSTLAIAWIQICNNYFDNTGLRLDYVNHPVVTGNSFNCPLIATPLSLTNCSADAVNANNLVVSA